nr:hypothetical protein [Tanacetum cinerariifolium]
GEGSGTPTEPHHTPSPKAQQISSTTHSSPTLPPVTTFPIPTVTPSDTPHLRQYTRRARIAQSLALPTIADEPASPLRDVSQGKACPTVYIFEAEQDRANIAKTSTLPYESTSRVTSLAADKGSMQHKLDELTALYTSLQRQQSEMVSRDDAPIKRRNLDEGEEAAERVKVATATVSISAGSDVVPTASPIFATATVVTPYTRRKGKEKMVETDTPKKKKFQEQMDIQMARQLEEEIERDTQRMNKHIIKDAEEYEQFADNLLIGERVELINDLIKYQENYAQILKYQTQQRKPWSKKQKRDYYMAVIKSNLGWKVKDFKGMTFKEIEAKFTTVWKQIEDFIPISSKEEAERFKRKGIIFKQESVKKLKTSEEVKATEEVPEEKIKEMMQLVPVEENMMHAPVEWKLYDSCEVHHVTSKDNKIFMLIEKDYPLRKGLAIVMICYKLQVENYSQMASDLILKIHKIANRPRQEDD